MTMGFMVEGRIYGEADCQHVGDWSWDVYNGVLFQFCGRCGKTWVLASTDESRMYWEEVTREGEAHGNRVGILVEEVQQVRGDEAEQRVQSGRNKGRRKDRALQDLPPALQISALPEEEG